MSNPEKPLHQQPETPDFWDLRFRSGTTPWDAGCAPPALQEFAVRFEKSIGKKHPPPCCLVPGCGSAWDAAFLDRRGWRVTAIDFSPAAVATAEKALGGEWQGELRCADFFDFTSATAFDLIYERAFLCALPRKLWPAYAQRMAELLPAGGLLAGIFFVADQPKGPPFGILQARLDELLGPFFVQREDLPVAPSLPVFADRERWQVWERR